MKVTSNVLLGAVTVLNQPLVKESLKNVIGITTCVFGVIEICDEAVSCYRSLKGRIRKNGEGIEPWWRTALRVVVIVTNISLVASVFTSRPGLAMSGWVVERIFTPDQLLRYFGPNVNFVGNPLHPRHVLSIISFAMGVPATIKTAVDGGKWFVDRIIKKQPAINETPQKGITVQHKQWMATWNTLTSRPALHAANRFFQIILRRA